MYTPREYGLIAWKWLLSFSKNNWQLNDYPVYVRRNGENPEPPWAWIAQILNWPGPSGLGGTHQEAIENLKQV